jgi:hypothetical protein
VGATTVIPVSLLIATIFTTLVHENIALAVMADKRTGHANKIDTALQIILAVSKSLLHTSFVPVLF